MTLEICTNHEWWLMFSTCGDATDPDAVGELIRQLTKALERAGHSVLNAKGQRQTCHGWNGANVFRRKCNGIGTFDEVTNDEWGDVLDVLYATLDQVCVKYPVESE